MIESNKKQARQIRNALCLMLPSQATLQVRYASKGGCDTEFNLDNSYHLPSTIQMVNTEMRAKIRSAMLTALLTCIRTLSNERYLRYYVQTF